MARKISQEHLDAYLTGDFATLLTVIKEDPELSFDIRMNDEVKIYYNKGLVLTTKRCLKRKQHFTVTPLDKGYYKDANDKIKKKADALPNIQNVLNNKSKLEEYFKNAKDIVYFHAKDTEFTTQQYIALGNNSFDKRFVVVDMEWAYSQADVNLSNRMPRTKIDLVIVDTVKNSKGVNDIYLAELKVGTGAKDGKSGIKAHVKKTNNIISDKNACASLKADVESLIEQKTALRLISGTPKQLTLADKPKMMIIAAYRGNNEKIELEKGIQTAKEEANRLNMEEPVCIMYDCMIEIKL